MTKARLLAFPLSLALALAGASAVVAQEEEAPAEAPEYSTAAGQWVYGWLQTWMSAAGMAEEEVEEELADLDEWYGNLSEADLDDLAELYVASEGISRITDEIGDGSFSPFSDDGDDDTEDDDTEDDDAEGDDGE